MTIFAAELIYSHLVNQFCKCLVSSIANIKLISKQINGTTDITENIV